MRNMEADRNTEKRTKKLVVVLGMHRSGTSLVTQLCQRMGAYLGSEDELMPASKANPDGYFENLEIYRLNETLLHSCGREWYSLEPAEVDLSCQQTEKIVEDLRGILQKLLEKSDVAAVKDPRICILLPVWEKVLKQLGAEITYVWAVRNPLEVAESLKKRAGYSRRHSLLLWVHHNLEVLKYLKGKKYCLLHYQEVLENGQACKKLGALFEKDMDDGWEKELRVVVKQEYRHSKHSRQEVQELQEDLPSDLYNRISTETISAPLCIRPGTGRQKEQETEIEALKERYMKEVRAANDRNMDYAFLENNGCLSEKKIVIYGTGNCGKRAAEMLQRLGYSIVCFCDRDRLKQRYSLMGKKVASLAEIEEKGNLLFVIATENAKTRKEAEQTVSCVKGAQFLSFFALELAWASSVRDDGTMADWADSYALWYRNLEMRGNNIRSACRCPVLVYQNEMVGASAVSESLWKAGVENAHIHRIFYKDDIVRKLIFGDGQENPAESTNAFRFSDTEYVRRIKAEMKNKKIITLVREPIAVDLSTVFQWIATGEARRYLAKRFRQGKTLPQITVELMVKIQNRLFDWFDEELRELCGIHVLAFPFDKEKGYTTLSENGVEVLLIKTEKLSGLTEVIRDFTDNRQIILSDGNAGNEKEYAHIYKAVKERITLPKEYVEHYYNHNPYMDHFYSKKEQEHFLHQWSSCITD